MGTVWPFATSQTLTGLAKLLRSEEQTFVSPKDFFQQLLTYATAHQHHGVAYVGEYHDEVTGDWLIKGPKAQRSRFYNHSTFNDLVIHGLVGIVPREDHRVEVHPLLPADTWDWFCLDGVLYHDHSLTVIWDRTGVRYGRGPGLTVWVDGAKLVNSASLTRVVGVLPIDHPTDDSPPGT